MTSLVVRPGRVEDVAGICAMLTALKAAGKRTRPCDEGFVEASYVNNPLGVSCLVAVDAPKGEILGLQILSHAYEDNPYGAAMGYGIIGTHVAPNAARRGVGRALFAETLKAARGAGLPVLEAYIQTANAEGHAYYGAMGFVPVREDGTALVRALTL